MPKRKKHPGRVVGEIVPPDAARRDEIVEEIIENLQPWKIGSRNAIAAAVDQELQKMMMRLKMEVRLPQANSSFAPKQIRKFFKSLDKTIGKVEGLFDGLKGNWYFFDPTVRRLAKVDDDVGDFPSDDSKEAIQARADQFLKELARIRKVATTQIGRHPNFDPTKHECARSARRLMEVLSDGKITGTEGRAFRLITGLLYEAVSGKRDAELKRACDAVLKENLGRPIRY